MTSIFDEDFKLDRPGSTAGDGLSFADRVSGWGRDAVETLDRPARIGRVYDAALQQTSVVEQSNSAHILREQRVDGLIAAVERAAGVKLENPHRGGYYAEALTADAGGSADRFRDLRDDLLDRQMGVFTRKLDELRQSNPAVAAALGDAERELAPRAIATRANADLAAAREDATYLGSALGMIGGGAVAAFRDPIAVAGLVLGGGASAARSVVGRLASVAIREAGINAGVTAAQQPFVQANKADLGLDHGWADAAESVAMAAAIGGVFGTGIQGAREVARVLKPAERAGLDKALSPDGSAADVASGLREAGIPLAREDAELLDQAVRAERADRRMEAERPPEVSAARHEDALAAALARAESPSAPSPELPYPTRPNASDEAALAILERDDLHPAEALSILRDDPALIESALASRSPAIREAGAVSLLHDDAFAYVLDDLVDPRHAALVVRASSAPERQAAMMADLAELRPGTVAEAREIVEAAQAAAAARDRNASLMNGRVTRVDDVAETGLFGDDVYAAAVESAPTRAERWRTARIETDRAYGDWTATPPGPERDALAARYLDLYAEAVDAVPANRSGGITSGPNSGSNVARQIGSDMTPPVWATSTASAGDQVPSGSDITNALRAAGDSTAGLEPQLMKIMDASLPARDVRALVPTVRDDGTVAFLPKGQSALARERDDFLGAVIAACKV